MAKEREPGDWTPVQQLRDARRAGDTTKMRQLLKQVAGINDGWREWATVYRDLLDKQEGLR